VSLIAAQGSDEGVVTYTTSHGVSECSSFLDPNHYERPRAEWLLDEVGRGTTLEIGCGDGGLTAVLCREVDRVVALDVSRPSIRVLEARRLPDVETHVVLLERLVLWGEGVFDDRALSVDRYE
jgi:hypothetical protein